MEEARRVVCARETWAGAFVEGLSLLVGFSVVPLDPQGDFCYES